MKTLTSLKHIPAIIVIAVFALVFNGCKKADLKPASIDNKINIDAERAKAAALIAKEGGIPQISYGFTGANGDDPCERNDKAWVTTQPGPGGNMIVVGYNGSFSYACGYGGSFVAPDLQEVQYNIDGGTWTNMSNSTANSSWQIFGSA